MLKELPSSSADAPVSHAAAPYTRVVSHAEVTTQFLQLVPDYIRRAIRDQLSLTGCSVQDVLRMARAAKTGVDFVRRFAGAVLAKCQTALCTTPVVAIV